MRILHVINSLGTGGAEKLVLDTLPKLKDKGINVELLVLKTVESNFESALIKQGVVLHSLGVKSIYNPVSIIKVRAYLRKYDLIHVHLFPAQYWVAFAWMLISQKKRPRLITTEHNTSNRRRNIPFFKIIDKYIYSKYKSTICITEGTRLGLVSHLGMNISTVVIENGIDLEKFIAASPLNRNEFNFDDNDIVITMVAGFRHQKDQDTLIRSMLYLPSNYKLLLVGIGQRMGICQKLCDKLNLNDRVVFTGLRNDIENIFAMSTLGVVSSHWEGFGLVAAECMATGRPVIASDVEGLRDVVDDSDLLFPVGNYKVLASKIIDLISDKELYYMKSISCQKNAEKYSLDKMVSSSIKLYKEMLK